MQRHEVISAVRSIDLDPIMWLLEREGMAKDEVIELSVEYRRFLALNALHPEAVIVPSEDVDKMWHLHITDTLKYGEDCEKIFGFFLHHNPYLSYYDAEAYKAGVIQTAELYEAEFDENRVRSPEDAARCCSGCLRPEEVQRPAFQYA